MLDHALFAPFCECKTSHQTPRLKGDHNLVQLKAGRLRIIASTDKHREVFTGHRRKAGSERLLYLRGDLFTLHASGTIKQRPLPRSEDELLVNGHQLTKRHDAG